MTVPNKVWVVWEPSKSKVLSPVFIALFRERAAAVRLVETRKQFNNFMTEYELNGHSNSKT